MRPWFGGWARVSRFLPVPLDCSIGDHGIARAQGASGEGSSCAMSKAQLEAKAQHKAQHEAQHLGVAERWRFFAVRIVFAQR